MKANEEHLSFAALVDSIRQVYEELSAQAGRVVNVSLTLRNWLIGCYIAEYELHGFDRARYGDSLAEHVKKSAETTEPKLAIRDPYIFTFSNSYEKQPLRYQVPVRTTEE